MKKNRDEVRYNKNEKLFFKNLKLSSKNLRIVENFPAYLTANYFRKFLIRYEAYKLTKHIPGSIFECGVGNGNGFFSWIHFKELFEPFNHNKKIIGFDTFKGFPNVSKQDFGQIKNKNIKKGGLNYNNYNEMKILLNARKKIYPLNHLDQFKLIKGNATLTIKNYLKKNPQTFISILYLDFDNYIPTLRTLENTKKNMSKGSIICFDELDHAFWPGEGRAIKKFFNNLNKIKIQKFDLGGSPGFYRVE